MKNILLALLLSASIIMAGCANPNRDMARAILDEDGVSAADQLKLEPTLTESIEKCCAKYRCGPADVNAAAHQVRDAMRRGGSRDASVTLAANLLYSASAASLKDSTASLVSVYESYEKKTR